MHRVFRCFVALSIFLLTFSAGIPHAGEEPAGAAALQGEIVLGATFPLTGELATYGQSAYYGANTRVRLINESGGIAGKRLVLEWRDNGSDPAQAVRDVQELVERHKVPAVLGPLLSDAVLGVRDTAAKLKVVILSPLSTLDASTRDNPWIFRACFNNSTMADGLINFQMNSYGAKSCGILFDSRRAFSRELSLTFQRKFHEKKGSVVGLLSIIGENGEKDYATPLRKLAESAPDFIFAPCYALEATELIHAAKELDIGIRFCGSDAWDNELVFDGSGLRLAGTAFASALFEQAFNYRPFQIFFNAMENAGMDNPDAPAACAYDAVSLLAVALQTGETSEDIRKGLLAVRRLSLATGRVSITPGGDTRKPMLIRIVERRGGRLVPVFAARYDP